MHYGQQIELNPRLPGLFIIFLVLVILPLVVPFCSPQQQNQDWQTKRVLLGRSVSFHFRGSTVNIDLYNVFPLVSTESIS